MKAPIAQSLNAPACAIGAFIGLHGQKRILIHLVLVFGLGLPLGSHFTVTGNFK
jgi:hypothetical protein